MKSLIVKILHYRIIKNIRIFIRNIITLSLIVFLMHLAFGKYGYVAAMAWFMGFIAMTLDIDWD